MSDKPTYQHGTPERGVVYAWEGEVAGLRAEIKRLQDEAGGTAMAAEQFGRQAESVKCKAEIERLRAGLNIIAQAGTLYGGGWCVAQAIGYRDDLDFDQFPETGKAPVDS